MSHSTTPTLELLNEAKEGNYDSLGRLLHHYFRYLNVLSRSHIDERIKARVSASDVVQETLLEAHRDFKSFVGTSLEEFTGWIRRILFNNLARAIERNVLAEKRDVRKQRSLNEKVNALDQTAGSLEALLAADVSSVSAAMQSDEAMLQLTRAIENLPPDYQTVLKLRHFEGLPFADIAARLDRKPGAIRMLWLRAVDKLRRNLPQPD